MRTLHIVLVASLFTFGSARSRGKNYEKEKVCEGLNTLGKEKFKNLFTVLYSQKFPNGTFEEVRCVADEMLKLAEKCCSEGATPDCYDTGATSISDISCGKDSPFPKHPGIGKCCAEQGLERKLCLASLRYTAEELPSLLETTNEEVCEQYRQNASGYASRYMYELARRHRSTPAELVLNATARYLQMIEKCCSPVVSNPCFLSERLQQRESNVFLRFTSAVCQNQVNLKSHKTGLTVHYGSILGIPFEEASSIASYLHDGLAKYCLEPNGAYIIQEFTDFHGVLCNDSTLATKSAEFQKCCSKPPLGTLTCVDDLKKQTYVSTGTEQRLSPHVCSGAGQDAIERYLFDVGVKRPSVSLPVMATVADNFEGTVKLCCESADAEACMEGKKSHLKRITEFVSKADDICSQYFKLDFSAFRKKVLRDVEAELPQAGRGDADARAAVLVEFATTCCSRHAPPVQCQNRVEAFITPSEDDSAV
ncbi:hypothetical protein MATL_G00065730 [Megalops atlanticus]|uniref:Vitamin D-binding protein n=1 Tax=Megalops atlanticus TaxID=7932 RepID=A0A9D3Q7T6_MEGAT|nr:hypothetical protein MATL_G00065730 [Megalops atlanticus]